jgi:hypothetical protein
LIRAGKKPPRSCARAGRRARTARWWAHDDFVPDAFNPEQIELMKAAFEAAWQFVQADAALGSVTMPERQAALLRP